MTKSTAKLNQIIAIEKGIKSQAYATVGELHKLNQKPTLFNGFSKSYLANDDAGEKLPSESQRVQITAEESLRALARQTTTLMDVTARKDWTNTVAKADVVVDDVTILKDVPVTYLLFLEKQANDIRTFVNALPILDTSEDWTFDDGSGLYKAAPVNTHRTNKVQKPIVLYDATDKHPAQTQLIVQDVIAGYWTTIRQSGAMPKTDKDKLLVRVEKLVVALKEAREAANGIAEIESPDVGQAIFGFLLPDASA